MTHVYEHTTLRRDVEVILIPSGETHKLEAGLPVRITQALGDSYTIMTSIGYLARVAAKDADALGKDPQSVPSTEPRAQMFSKELVWDELRNCYDPEIPVNIVDLGLIYDVEIIELADDQRELRVKMTLTAPGCGMGAILQSDIEHRLSRLPSVRTVQVELVLDPPWSPERMSESARLELGMM